MLLTVKRRIRMTVVVYNASDNIAYKPKPFLFVIAAGNIVFYNP